MNHIRSTRDYYYYHHTNWEPQLHAAWLFLRRGADLQAMMHHLVEQDEYEVEEIKCDRRRQRHQQKERECWILCCQEEWCIQEMKRQQEELEHKV
jgi:hypothetical protein